MNSRFLRGAREAADHARARELAAMAMDEPLAIEDAAWLYAHLRRCEACRLVAGEYEAQRTALRGLRAEQPEPPRDLWARTSAAMDAGRRTARPRSRLAGSVQLAPVAGLLVVAIVVGAGLLNGTLMMPPSGGTTTGAAAGPTPIAFPAAELQVISRAGDGRIEIRSSQVDELCPVGAQTCGASTTLDVTQSTAIQGTAGLDAIISPDRDRLVVVERGDGPQSVFVVPMTGAAAAATSSPKPGGIASTPTPKATASPAEATPKATKRETTPRPLRTASARPESVAPSPSLAVSSEGPVGPSNPASPSTPASSAGPSADTSLEPTPPTSEPPVQTATPEARPTPTGKPSPTDAAGPSAETVSPTPTVAVTPGPDGAIEIARNVIIVGSATSYSGDGQRFAFSARPADGSAGPDVYVWQTGESEATAVTTDHGSVFAGWLGDRVLASRVVDGSPSTFAIDPVSGAADRVGIRSMWLPTVGPDGAVAVWWDGTVTAVPGRHTWVPDTGRLILAPWPSDGGDIQALASEPIADWEVRWDEKGSTLAVWLLPAGDGSVGRLSLYPIDHDTGRPDLANPMLADAPANAGFSLRSGRLAWSAPDSTGDTSVEVLAWNGSTVGRLALPGLSGSSVVH